MTWWVIGVGEMRKAAIRGKADRVRNGDRREQTAHLAAIIAPDRPAPGSSPPRLPMVPHQNPPCRSARPSFDRVAAGPPRACVSGFRRPVARLNSISPLSQAITSLVLAEVQPAAETISGKVHSSGPASVFDSSLALQDVEPEQLVALGMPEDAFAQGAGRGDQRSSCGLPGGNDGARAGGDFGGGKAGGVKGGADAKAVGPRGDPCAQSSTGPAPPTA